MDEIKKRVRQTDNTPLTTRLIFAYDGDVIRLVSRKSVKMITPPSDPLEVKTQHSGFWFEVKDTKEVTLYRRIIQNPIKKFIEVRSENPDRPFTWEEVEKPSGTFVLLIPEIKNQQEIQLFSSPAEEGMKAPAKLIARFSLKADKKREGE